MKFSKSAGIIQRNIELQKMVDGLKRDKLEAQQNEERYRFLIENSVDSIWQVDEQLRVVYIAPTVEKLTGFRPDEMIGKRVLEFLAPDSVDIVQREFADIKFGIEAMQQLEPSEYAVKLKRKDGSFVWVETMNNPIFDADNHLRGFCGTARDINARRQREEGILRIAFQDSLTELPNRRRFETELEKAIMYARQRSEPLAVVFLDLDGLKKVNDAYGHAAGDAVLQVIADRLRIAVRRDDFVSRLGGDEFMVILPNVGDCDAVSPLSARLIEACSRPIYIGEKHVTMGASIGVCFFPLDADNVKALMNYADQAMYRAKESGGCRVCYR